LTEGFGPIVLGALKVPAFLVVLVGFAAAARSQSDDRPIHIDFVLQGDDVRVVSSSDRLLDYNVTLNLKLENMKASEALPFSRDVRGLRNAELLVLHIVDLEQPWDYQFNDVWKNGTRGGVPDSDAVYQLPFGPAESHALIQGYHGTFSHQTGTPNEYAYDFAMPVGTTVCASRSGVVVGVRQDSDVRGDTVKFMHSDNYVIVRHSDGTYAEYRHFEKNGVLVGLGAEIQAGQPIGLSGVTGYTTQPHVHFAVFRLVDTPGGVEHESLPIAMKTQAGMSRSLIQGVVYWNPDRQ
jgi:murein DD-endopeptidase MepM/ murein hydrolase activator NlpD